jgi:hypothetical protein
MRNIRNDLHLLCVTIQLVTSVEITERTGIDDSEGIIQFVVLLMHSKFYNFGKSLTSSH